MVCTVHIIPGGIHMYPIALSICPIAVSVSYTYLSHACLSVSQKQAPGVHVSGILATTPGQVRVSHMPQLSQGDPEWPELVLAFC